MRGLFIKDLKMFASQKKLLLIAIFVALLLIWNSDNVTNAAGYMIVMLPTISLMTLSYDDINGGMLFILSLPVDRKTYVKEKYLFIFVTLVCSYVLSVVLCGGLSFIKYKQILIDGILSNVMGMMVGMGLMLAVAIPFEFKYGVEKGRIAMIIVMATVAITGLGGYKLLANVFKVDVGGLVESTLSNLPQFRIDAEIMVLIFLFALLLAEMFCSYLFSQNIIKRKEF